MVCEYPCCHGDNCHVTVFISISESFLILKLVASRLKLPPAKGESFLYTLPGIYTERMEVLREIT